MDPGQRRIELRYMRRPEVGHHAPVRSHRRTSAAPAPRRVELQARERVAPTQGCPPGRRRESSRHGSRCGPPRPPSPRRTASAGPGPPGCSCTGTPSYCHTRSACTTSLNSSTPGVLNTIVGRPDPTGCLKNQQVSKTWSQCPTESLDVAQLRAIRCLGSCLAETCLGHVLFGGF